MTIKEARKLSPGDKVKQKMHGYIMTVESIEDSKAVFHTTNEFVNILCRTDNGDLMKHNHKELIFVTDRI